MLAAMTNTSRQGSTCGRPVHSSRSWTVVPHGTQNYPQSARPIAARNVTHGEHNIHQYVNVLRHIHELSMQVACRPHLPVFNSTTSVTQTSDSRSNPLRIWLEDLWQKRKIYFPTLPIICRRRSRSLSLSSSCKPGAVSAAPTDGWLGTSPAANNSVSAAPLHLLRGSFLISLPEP